MFRTRSKLSTGAAVIAVIVALYSAGWLYLAHRVGGAVDDFIEREHGQGVNLIVLNRTIEGFPWRIEVRLSGIAANGLPREPAGHLTVPTATAWARPWRLGAWRFALLDGATIEAPQGHVRFGLLGGHAGPVLGPGATPGGELADVHLDDLEVGNGDRLVKIARTGFVLRLPPVLPQAHEEPLFSLSLQTRKLTLPSAVAPLGQEIDHLQMDATWRGPVPSGKLVDALAAWRDGGGTIELQSIDLGWGPLSATADGTLALDKDMQPLGAFSARIMGYDAILDALIASGAIPQNQASVARLGLSMMTQRGADGTPQLKTPVTIQDGGVFMGPARLAKLAKLSW